MGGVVDGVPPKAENRLLGQDEFAVHNKKLFD